jgi:ethanolamine utilization protein EutA
MEINEIEILSVGVDVGSSTSHLVFSNILLKRDERSVSRRFNIDQRNIIYEGRIIRTPLLDDETLDIDKLGDFFKEEYKRAGIDPADIQTGAVILTGESAKKQNARQIAESLSNDAGKFVAATAGPNFESLIAAMGSGATARSKLQRNTILSCDIGGGTSNMAISRNGETVSTSCISVGGRLLGVNAESKIWRIDQPAMKVMQYLGLDYRIGNQISKADLEKIADTFAEVLLEAITGPAKSSLARQLMLTADLNFPPQIDEYSFSGGVAELMYGHTGDFDDIRATVIGAGAYSLSISGSSGFMDQKISFPIRNVPVIRVDIDNAKLSPEHIMSQINTSFRRFDLAEGDDIVALYFKDPVRASYPQLELFAKSIEAALPRSIHNKLPIILIFETDIACSVGSVMRRETELKTNLLALDELTLKEGDWVDIGEPLIAGQVFPVTVKSLVFYSN